MLICQVTAELFKAKIKMSNDKAQLWATLVQSYNVKLRLPRQSRTRIQP